MKDYLEKLNSNQKEAAFWNEGPLLVLAGPGSGKTATLTARVARLMEDSQGASFRILCLTFTKKAAAEMRERLYKLVPDVRDRVILTTTHSFATDILRQHGSYYGLTPDFEIIEDDTERIYIVRDLLTNRANDFARIVSAEKALASIDFLFRNLISDEEVVSRLKDRKVSIELRDLFIAYKQALRQQNTLDYGAILYFCEEMLVARPRLAKQLRTVYWYICVDEFQDTNLAQYRLFRALTPERNSNLFIVGDDDQIIYQWNGASPSRINELEQHYDLTTIQLPENYRCPAKVVALANKLIQHNRERSTKKRPLEAMRNQALENPVLVKEFENEKSEANWVAKQLAEKLQFATPAELVVLARNTKLLERVAEALARLKIEACLQKRKSQFESAPLRFIVSALKLAVVRADNDLAATLTKSLSDCINHEIDTEDLVAWATQTNGDYLEAFGRLVQQFDQVPKTIHSGVSFLLQGKYPQFLENAFDYFDSLEVQQIKAEGREAFADYRVEREVWRSILRDFGGDVEAYRMSLGQFLQELALANKTPEAPPTAIRCLTIHASKGMEFKHVFLIGLAEDQLPSFQSKKAGDESREMQEERRNCFVAITRTIETLTLTYAKEYNGWTKNPSRFLFEMAFARQKTTS